MKQHKPVIETLINTAALTLTSFGIIAITQNGDWGGYIAISFGMILEYAKYVGRARELW